MKKKIHYGGVDRAHEGQMFDEWTDPICNTYAEEPQMTDKESEVTCGHCINLINKSNDSIKD